MHLPTARIIRVLKTHWTLCIVIVIALIIAGQNTSLTKSYSGWDNILAEFDLPRYAAQVFFGAWSDHQGLGAPSAQGQLSEIFRLPILFVLNTLLPPHLIRYVFIFAMYLIGGIGMYWYLYSFWLKKKSDDIRNWLAALGGVFYLLHILTLQQFYIAFEMFTVQFAYLPFLLMSVHLLTTHLFLHKNPTFFERTITHFRQLRRNIAQSFRVKLHLPVPELQEQRHRIGKHFFLFLLLQFLIAPSGHTPTVFYLAVLFTQLYAFFLVLPQGLLRAVKAGILIGLLTLAFNAYWIIPNVYYTTHNARYVQENHENNIFGPESVWSIREASTLSNMLKGTHYLFTWKDYSFEHKEFQYIFNEWQDHLHSFPVSALLTLFGILTIMGVVLTAADKEKGSIRWAVVLFYLFCLAFIWIDLFPTKYLFDLLYRSPSFLEAFRNPFTKLSILYSVVSIILFIQTLEFLFHMFSTYLGAHHWINTIHKFLIVSVLSAIIYTAWPSFQGHFLSEKLQLQYPSQYTEMFAYLRQRPRHLRVLQLPQLSHAGWEYYDWQFLGRGNGYQGMGFYFFGMPQPFLNRDADRWVETSDFFYHELKYALDLGNVDQFTEITNKYNVDLFIVDETRMDPHRTHDFARDYLLLTQAGYNQIWQKDFLTIYERPASDTQSPLYIPETITPVAAITDRVRVDTPYQNHKDYLISDTATAIQYPFVSLLHKTLDGFTVTDDTAQIQHTVPLNTYTLTVPAIARETWDTPVTVSYQDQMLRFTFPQYTLTTDDYTNSFPTLPTRTFAVPNPPKELIIFMNTTWFRIKYGEQLSPVVHLQSQESLQLSYTSSSSVRTIDDGSIDLSTAEITPLETLLPDWRRLQTPLSITTHTQSIGLQVTTPIKSITVDQNPSVNCAEPTQGSIRTLRRLDRVIYSADGFGVNCNGYDFVTQSPAYSYVLNVTGKTLHGRGTKFFINYPDKLILPEDYLVQSPNFNTFFSLPAVSNDRLAGFYLNWETRSFGMTSMNEIQRIALIPFPLVHAAQISLTPTEIPKVLNNTVHIQQVHEPTRWLFFAEYTCATSECFIGLDQSFDDLWLALDRNTLQILPHIRANNWNNLWQVPSSGRLIILYIPELFSFLSVTITIGCAIILAIRQFIRCIYAKN